MSAIFAIYMRSLVLVRTFETKTASLKNMLCICIAILFVFAYRFLLLPFSFQFSFERILSCSHYRRWLRDVVYIFHKYEMNGGAFISRARTCWISARYIATVRRRREKKNTREMHRKPGNGRCTQCTRTKLPQTGRKYDNQQQKLRRISSFNGFLLCVGNYLLVLLHCNVFASIHFRCNIYISFFVAIVETKLRSTTNACVRRFSLRATETQKNI